AYNCLLQYSRSGRIAVTRSFEEPITEYLNGQDETMI
ncbi:MAG: acetolactate synthase small subunit, partial [Hallella bergensis]